MALPLVVHAVFLPILFSMAYKQHHGESFLKGFVNFIALIIAYMVVYMASEIIVALVTGNYLMIGIYLFIGLLMVVVFARVLQQVKKIVENPGAAVIQGSNGLALPFSRPAYPTVAYRFCPACGASLETSSSIPGQAPSPDPFRYCPTCGASLGTSNLKPMRGSATFPNNRTAVSSIVCCIIAIVLMILFYTLVSY